MGNYLINFTNIFFFTGAANTWAHIDNNDAETVTDVSGTQIGALTTAVYRDRLYSIGAGGATFLARRIYYSNLGVGTTFTTANDFFDVNDDKGEYPVGLYTLNDYLWIFKPNSIFRYNQTELKQTQYGVGAWNQRVIGERNGLMYIFGPAGVYVTNGLEVKNIGEPVRQYWENFTPTFEGTGDNRAVVNTFATVYNDKYLLYIGDVSRPESLSDVVLVYDILSEKWEVYDGFTDFSFLKKISFLQYGDAGNVGQRMEVLLGGADFTSNGRIYRFFENRYLDGSATSSQSHPWIGNGSVVAPTVRGSDIFQDLVANSGGNAINASFDTKMYHFNLPQTKKKVKKLHVLAENPGFTISWRSEKDDGRITPFVPLGTTDKTHHIFPLPNESEGYRLGLRVSFSDPNFRGTLNGFIFEDIYASL